MKQQKRQNGGNECFEGSGPTTFKSLKSLKLAREWVIYDRRSAYHDPLRFFRGART